jgi:hypothetical protein
VLILGVISIIQAVVMIAIGLLGRPLPKHGSVLTNYPLLELLIALAGLTIASMTLGLLISAVVNSSDKTLPLLVVMVMAQVVLSGGIFSLSGKAGIEQLSWLSPSRWGFAATASTSNLNVIGQVPGASAASGAAVQPDPLWDHTASAWLTDIGALLALGLAFAILTWWRLARTGPAKRR